MESKKIKKLLLNKKTISNLSKPEQRMVSGGYGDYGKVSWEPINWCPSRRNTMCNTDPCIGCPYPPTEILCPKTVLNDGGTCDSTINIDVTCVGNC